MRFKLIVLLFAALLVFLISCGNSESGFDNEGDGDYGVSFYDRGSLYCFTSVEEGDFSPEPTVPEWEGYDFIGWFNGDEAWEFSTHTVSGDVTLTAKWRVNFSVLFYSYNTDGVEISTNGDYMKIDINVSDKPGFSSEDDLDKIKEANEAVGLPTELYQQMVYTLSDEGTKTFDGEYVTVEWSNSPDTGLEVTYTRK